MPIFADQSKPVVQVDQSGKSLPVNTPEPHRLQVDSAGREVVDQIEVPDPTPATPTEQPKTDLPKNPEAEARKLFLQAQKAERKAKENEKKAQEGLRKANAIEEAIKATQSGGDPTAILKAAGLDPIKFYKDMTSFAISDKGKPEDPVQKELREHKERLDKYAKDIEVQTKTLEEKEIVTQKNAILSNQVIPLIMKNPDKYEALIAEYQDQAAIQVLNKVLEHYETTGEQISFEVAADALEGFWATQIENGINAASKLKKFSNRFAQSVSNTQRNQSEQVETPSRSSFTLSNKQSAVSQPPSNEARKRSPTKEERYSEILKKHGVI